MTKATRIDNNDNGLVDRTQEAILAGVSPDRPEDICTKYRDDCTTTKVKPNECEPVCCIPKTLKNPIVDGGA